MNRRGFLRSMLGLIGSAAVAPASILQIALPSNVRKLRSVWSCEAAQDLNALHGLDVDEEFFEILSKAIVEEIDRGIIADLRSFETETFKIGDPQVPRVFARRPHRCERDRMRKLIPI